LNLFGMNTVKKIVCFVTMFKIENRIRNIIKMLVSWRMILIGFVMKDHF